MPCTCPACTEQREQLTLNPDPCVTCGQSFLPGIAPDHRDAYGHCDRCSIRCVDCAATFGTALALDSASRCRYCTLFCSDCGEEYESRDDFDGDGRCPDCSTTCDRCGGSCSSVDSYGHCPNCHYECRACGADADTRSDLDAYRCCESCSISCNSCGEHCESVDDDGNCESCESSRADDPYTIHEYDFSPGSWNYHKTGRETSKFLFGYELEAEFPRDKGKDSEVEWANVDTEKWFWKHDGSISYGAECVSHPASYEYITSNDHFGWCERAWKTRGWKAWDTNTCGGHIHVSRNALSKLDIFKLLYLFSQNPKWVYKISRRKDRAKMDDYAAVQEDDKRTIIYKMNNCSECERYTAINISNRKTIEFRLFRGTLSKAGIIGNIALTYMLCSYVKETAISDLSPESFRVWVRNNAHKYISAGAKELVLNIANRRTYGNNDTDERS